MTCQKCGSKSGGDWEQCAKLCPEEASPYFNKEFAVRLKGYMDTLSKIKPGETYPDRVVVTEVENEVRHTVRFCLQSYAVGMYMAVYFDDEQIPLQTGDHDNKKTVRILIKDLKEAAKRGATIEFGCIRNCKNDCLAANNSQ